MLTNANARLRISAPLGMTCQPPSAAQQRASRPPASRDSPADEMKWSSRARHVDNRIAGRYALPAALPVGWGKMTLRRFSRASHCCSLDRQPQMICWNRPASWVTTSNCCQSPSIRKTFWPRLENSEGPCPANSTVHRRPTSRLSAVTISEGTIAGYVVEELLELRPQRERIRGSNHPKPPESPPE